MPDEGVAQVRKIEGVVTALATPFKAGKVDLEAFKRLVEHQVEAGVDWVLVAGTTGEGAVLSLEEKGVLLDAARDICAGRCGVMAGVSGIGTEEVAAQARGLASAGAEALLVAVPPYVKPPAAGLADHFVKVAEAAGKIPVMLYNVPSRTGLDTPVKVYTEAVRKASNIVAVKEAVWDVTKVSRVRLSVEDMAVLSGNDATALAMICLGAEGVVSVAANVAPQDMVSLVRAARSGDLPAARKLHERLLPLFDALFMETNPVPLKAALHIMALSTDEVRSPLSPPRPDTIHTLQTVLLKLGLI